MPYTPPPTRRPALAILTPWSNEAIGMNLAAYGLGSAFAGAVLAAADTVFYVPFDLTESFVVVEVGWYNSSVVANGNAQVGAYNEAGTQLVECAATTTAGTNALQTINVTDTTLPGPGRFYMAFRASSTTDRFFRLAPAAGLLEAAGVMQEASQTDLPATMTGVAMATAYLPYFYLAGHTLL